MKPSLLSAPTFAGRQLRRAIFFGLLLVIWEIVSRKGPWPAYLFPGPLEVLSTLRHGIADGSVGAGVLVSVRRLAVGFFFSVAIGTLLGLATARFELARETLGSLILSLQALPSICWLPLALVWFGLNERAILFVVVMGSLLSVAIAADHSIRHIPQLYLRVAKNLGARGFTLYRHVVLPAALPVFVSGLKQGWSFAWRSLMAGELLFVGPGLGRLLMMGRELNDMSQVIAVMLVIVTLGLIVDRFIFGEIEKRLARAWGPSGLSSA